MNQLSPPIKELEVAQRHPKNSSPNLYKRMGGKTIFLRLERLLLERLETEGIIAQVDKPFQMSMRYFLGGLLQAPVAYSGKYRKGPMNAWTGLELAPSFFDSLVDFTEASLKELDIAESLLNEILALFEAAIHQKKLNHKNQNVMTTPAVPQSHQNGENSLLDSYYQQILDQSLDAVITINNKKEILYFNPAAEKMWGYQKDEVLGKNVKEIVPIEHRMSHDGYVDANLRSGKDNIVGTSRELEIERKDGTRFWGNLALTKVEIEGETQYTAFLRDVTAERENRLQAVYLKSAVDTGWASIEFTPEGTIVNANDNFVAALGYNSLQDIVGQHHRIFCEEKYANSPEYKAFWRDLANGNVSNGEFKRITQQGEEIWISASYAPVKDESGHVVKVIKIAADITNMVRSRVQADGIQSAVNTGWASIEFEPDGTILHANDNFVAALGYGNVRDIQGQHHRIFCDHEYANSREYKDFWRSLADGQVQSGEFKRFTRQGDEIWINASYTPVKNEEGKVIKVIKIANDVTDMVRSRRETEVFSRELAKAIQEIAGGNFDFELAFDEVTFERKLQAVIDDLLDLRDNLKGILQEVNSVVDKAGNEGQLSARLEMDDVKGQWKDLVASLNSLLSSIADPVMEFNRIVSAMADGDMTQRFEMRVAGDLENMANGLNQAIDNLSVLLHQIEQSAKVVAESSDTMLGKSESMRGNTAEVASATAQMSKGAQEQAIKTDESSRLVEEVMTSANTMAGKADIINSAAEKGQQSCDNGMKIVKRLVENMTEISQSANLTSDSISILKQRAEEIARTLNVITDIAAQTNLLALNAAIEAARAGEAGRGFAVVAEEIRKLAEDSRQSAVDIEKTIGDVQKDTQAASKAIEDMEGSVKQGNGASKEVEEIFEEIAESSNETFDFSREIQQASVEQKGSIDTVVKNIEQIVVVAEETAAGSQQVASSSQELNAGMTEITESSTNLSQIAAELLQGVNQFKLEKNNGTITRTTTR